MLKLTSLVVTVLGVAICTACADRLTAPQAVQLVSTVEESLAPGGNPQRWLGGIWRNDLRLGAISATPLRRDGEPLAYQTIVLERVVVPSDRAETSNCTGVRRAAYFWRGDGDGVVFFSGGFFDERLVPTLASCLGAGGERPSPLVTAVTPDGERWLPESVQGEIAPGVVTGPCAFLEPEAERVLRGEHGIICEMTRHRVTFAAELRSFGAAGLDTIRFHLDTTEMVGVRYTIDCNTVGIRVSVPCVDPTRRPPQPVDQSRPR